MTFKEYTTKRFSKVSSQLGLLSGIRNNLTVEAAEKVYKAMILPKLDYSFIVILYRII